MTDTATAVKTAQKALSAQELSYFCGQLSMIVSSGISVSEGLSLMLEDSADRAEQEILSALTENFERSGSLSHALELSGLFPEYMCSMVQLGEEAGSIDEVMASLQTHYLRETQLRHSIRSAVTYPAAMLGMMTVVVTLLLTKVMPLFNRVFIQLGTELSGFSLALMNLGSLINRYGLLLLGILLLFIVLLLLAAFTARGKQLVRRLGYRFGFSRSIYEKTAACRFAGALALTVKSGLSTDRGMELAARVSDDPCFLRRLRLCSERLEEGESLSKALAASGIFTGMYARLASVGERTGALDSALESIAERCQDEVDTKLNNMLSILEPTLVILLSVIVGVILLSVMLPLMGIMSGI